MQIDQINIYPLNIPFNMRFSHSSYSRDKGDSILVTIKINNSIYGVGEGCPRHYVSGETTSDSIAQLSKRINEFKTMPRLDELIQYIDRNQDFVRRYPAAWCALETALLDCMAKRQACSLEDLLGTRFEIPERKESIKYSAVLGTDNGFSALLKKYISSGFSSFKLKLSGDFSLDQSKIQIIRDYKISRQQLRADANNLWHSADQVSEYLLKLDNPFCAIEEPFVKHLDVENIQRLIEYSDIDIILDESFKCAHDLAAVKDLGGRIIPNYRVSKLGGLINCLSIYQDYHERFTRHVIGAHVGESSVLTRAAIVLANAFSGQCNYEGAFGKHLLKYDVTDPQLMFDQTGQLRPPEYALYGQAGLGLQLCKQMF